MAQTKDTQTDPTGSGKGRWRKWLLVGSLGLNLMVAGLVAGAMLGGGPDGRPSRLDLTVGPLTRAMAEEDRASLRAQLRAQGAFDHRERIAMRADMVVMLGLVRAETFDTEAFRDVVLRQRTRLANGQDRVLAVVASQIANMSREDRAAFADRLEDQLRRDSPPPQRD
ncbi:MAG: periplasmic heavy metal sensor [Octadecabacter sp.]|nr:periplasmic heavy metal sensor [Octadecabacter sp.]